MKIDLDREEWGFFKMCAERKANLDSWLPIKEVYVNKYKILLEKLGDEWKEE